ncbi:protein adenylyltransferase SelO [Phaeobacter gallaeciensis]|uniref:protein adenylyltransferase SelO n=1 Tax=Phaeobacter gallaeciensis TaxID=60890 RepID=UPI00237FCDE8|nr:YdiU family protein [Phaeobacter gallaeciensis]MDE4189737.1 YdiU family protein [Phaeobacter gallaeciensis]MDE4198890.1 YdiU family protein [Phaeobacter gallaeciensis]MDE4203037.1 YdiU family protein [Phaeobacter gallaeciensis]MDE4207179.1 YdiU family protein [Phaeobacter gallaeciensis]MDE4215597.1 YdiU family protein [Phaeobacter gallaeciensis]
MTLHIPFDNTYAQLAPQFYSKQVPEPVSAPRLLAFNNDLAQLMGITPGDLPEMAEVFGGNRIPEGADPLAQLYAGHQFGNFNPQLGDGRAILLGETIGSDGKRRDIQLKGSGRTPYSRQGDGRAWLGPVLREYVVSEAMHALGIPTTRALAAVETGDPVWREGAKPGAVLTRVAASHLRVGTFQIFAARGDVAALQRLTQYAIDRHYPDAQGPMGLLRAVRDAQARLVAQWMSVGFIHGVMNTDNCAISGETIDYGPCAFMDTYNPSQVFSSIDRMGRYAYDNQPGIIVWNLAQLATALIQQLDDPQAGVEEATEIVHAMPGVIEREWLSRFAAKVGIATPEEGDMALIEDLLERMAAGQADFTNAFRALAGENARDQFLDPAAFDSWAMGWRQRLETEENPEALMRQVNPAFIPRNHRIEEMIAAAVDGDMAPFERLNLVLARPFEDQPEHAELQNPPRPEEVVAATFCGT